MASLIYKHSNDSNLIKSHIYPTSCGRKFENSACFVTQSGDGIRSTIRMTGSTLRMYLQLHIGAKIIDLMKINIEKI